MGSSMSFFTFMYLSFLLFSFQITSSRQPLCHDKEHSALLTFKESLFIDHEYFLACSAKTELWNLEGNGDCCSWDGVKCSEDTGYVIKLDLSSSCLSGSINSTSTLFHLVHLQWLSLAYNNFTDSKIPSGIMNLSRLSHLNLSHSYFSGQIPPEMLELSNLESLDLSGYWSFDPLRYELQLQQPGYGLQLQQPNLKSLVEKLTNLKVLDLSSVNNISSSQLEVLTDLSSLKFLSLQNCNLKGTIPSSLGNLYNLIHLDLSDNNFLGQIPSEMLEFSQLEYLDLSYNWDSSLEKTLQLQQPSGLRSLVDKLTNLKWLDLTYVNISSSIPTSLGNLSSLTHLSLYECNLQGQIPSEMLELSQLEYLDLSYNWDSSLEKTLQLQQPVGLRSLVDKLTNLKWLDLTWVNISSSIPNSLGNLSSLTHLSLSDCNLQGQIPSEMLELSQLEYLDLSYNYDSLGKTLQLQQPGGLRSLVDKLTNLKWLDLTYVNISSSIPTSLGNLSSLTHLSLCECNLQGTILSSLGNLSNLIHLDLSYNNFWGEIPSEMFELSQLEYLDLSYNWDLQLRQPASFDKLTNLKWLDLNGVSISSSIPNSLGNLSSLTHLSLRYCELQGTIPSSIGSLTKLLHLDISVNNFRGELSVQTLSSVLGNLTQLNTLRLSYNNFSSGNSSSWSGIAKHTKLTQLRLSGVNLAGEIPIWLMNLTHLSSLYMSSNKLSGPIPFWFMKLNQLLSLDLSSNQLQVPIPSSFFELNNLEYLDLSSNNLSGTMELEMFLQLNSLSHLDISSNRLSLLSNFSVNASSSHKFRSLSLGSCNLRSFPDFLRYQDQLVELDLSSNNISGQIPGWFLNISENSLLDLNLSHNLLTGFDQQPVFLPWTSTLHYLDLSFNKLQGPLPISPISTIEVYLVSNNNLSGELSPWICKLNSLYALDVSNNNLSGKLPECLGNFSNRLLMLNLQNNKFHGSIPQTFMNGTELRMIDLSNNMFGGKIPRSLANCTLLEFLDLGNNEINDTFPSWIGNLPNLVVLNLQSNKLYGVIKEPKSDFEFPKLQIIDLSHNRFTGKLPSNYFACWNAMKVVNESQLAYMMKSTSGWDFYDYSLRMVNKGIEIEYEKISNMLMSICLSNNRFEGEIPASISILHGLRYLNLSNNNLVGRIPSSLDNLTVLESLDLSNNNLSGEIPPQLIEITSLEVFDVSHNHLTGPVPHGNQFNTFENSSYDGNPGLCGKPLSKECENFEPTPKEDEDMDSPFVFDWKLGLIGFSSGLIVGVVLGQEFYARKHEWFVKTFGIQIMKRKTERRN